MVHMLNQACLPMDEMFRTIRWIGVRGAPIDAQAMQLLHSRLHHSATVGQIWGMTEFDAGENVPLPGARRWG